MQKEVMEMKKDKFAREKKLLDLECQKLRLEILKLQRASGEGNDGDVTDLSVSAVRQYQTCMPHGYGPFCGNRYAHNHA